MEDAVEAKDTVVLADTKNVEKLTFKNGTLYTDRNATEGFSVSPDVKVVLALAGKDGNGAGKDWFDDVSDGYTGYSGLEKALRDMNSQGTFKAGTVEVSAILENDVATSIVINDKNAPSTGVQNPSIAEGEFAPAMWNGTEIELRYYQTPMTDSEIKAAISEILDGEPVERLNKYMGYVVMENGDMYKVDFDQIEVVAISVDGDVVAYPDKGTTANLTGLPAGAYFDINENPTGVITAPQLNVGANGKATVNNTSKDREFVTAYEVSYASLSDVSAKMDNAAGTNVATGSYVAADEDIVLTLGNSTGSAVTYKVTVDGDDEFVTVAKDNSETMKITVTGKVAVTTVADYMTAGDIEDVVGAYDPTDPKGDGSTTTTGATITVVGTTLNIKLASTVTNITDRSQVKDTGLIDLATDLLTKGNSIRVTFENGDSMSLTAANMSNMINSLKDNVGTLPMGDRTTSVSVVITNTASGESAEYTVVISQAKV